MQYIENEIYIYFTICYNYCSLKVTHFHHSAIATTALLDSQGASKSKLLHLVQDVITRWNSHHLMMKRLLQLRIAVFTVLHNAEVIKVVDREALEIPEVMWKVIS